MSNEESECEDHFISTHKREECGRYIVKLPLKSNYVELGESKGQAIRRFELLENKLSSNPELKGQYCQFINEYIQLEHMKPILESNTDSNVTYYMPHHALLKPTSSTTKLRVVFDASAKSSNQLSLNDVLKVGPIVQQPLFSIILRFRKYKFVFCTDIAKMYRQIKIDKSDTCLQRIIWRSNPDQNLQTYEFLTVTYGTSNAPYLATRVLKQLALDEAHEFPLASQVALNDFYVDDLLSGSDQLDQAKAIQSELIAMLSKGGFKLHKWCTNNVELLDNIPECDREKTIDNQYRCNDVIKTLGLLWNPTEDTFNFLTNIIEIPAGHLITKRTVLSAIAKLYDPLGLKILKNGN